MLIRSLNPLPDSHRGAAHKPCHPLLSWLSVAGSEDVPPPSVTPTAFRLGLTIFHCNGAEGDHNNGKTSGKYMKLSNMIGMVHSQKLDKSFDLQTMKCENSFLNSAE
ncbi:hypothetical protein KC19_VG328000 [Ceratodon purpureus]|uniref:Uncharacterized protein n=1 Tax=Ceratodon purpureus TaxID=3225 RepID=A0A8T0HX21_CERPU|nr:hypothetical protein KC19_VG328000 [Ceratodon purpureus]